MTTRTASRLAGLQLVNPDRQEPAGHWHHDRVPAARPDPLPVAPRPLDVAVAGAGRMRDLPAWLAETHGTSLVVVDSGVVVHEWYAAGLGADDLFLGASMTKSALAHLVGLAVGAGALALTTGSPRTCPSWPAPATTAARCSTCSR